MTAYFNTSRVPLAGYNYIGINLSCAREARTMDSPNLGRMSMAGSPRIVQLAPRLPF
jgi:hypothetical protein